MYKARLLDKTVKFQQRVYDIEYVHDVIRPAQQPSASLQVGACCLDGGLGLTVAPSDASMSAVSMPMPAVAPVTIASLPSKHKLVYLSVKKFKRGRSKKLQGREEDPTDPRRPTPGGTSPWSSGRSSSVRAATLSSMVK